MQSLNLKYLAKRIYTCAYLNKVKCGLVQGFQLPTPTKYCALNRCSEYSDLTEVFATDSTSLLDEYRIRNCSQSLIYCLQALWANSSTLFHYEWVFAFDLAYCVTVFSHPPWHRMNSLIPRISFLLHSLSVHSFIGGLS